MVLVSFGLVFMGEFVCRLDVIWLPTLVDGGLGRGVEPEDRENRFIRLMRT
jgi:hypothetical protein